MDKPSGRRGPAYGFPNVLYARAVLRNINIGPSKNAGPGNLIVGFGLLNY